MEFRKLIVPFLVGFALMALPCLCFATGTFTTSVTTKTKVLASEKRVVTVSWVAAVDASLGSATINVVTQGIQGWYLYSIDSTDGNTTSTADVVIGDAVVTDWSDGALANIGTWATYNFGLSPYGYRVVNGNLTLTVSNNAQASATGSVTLTFIPE